jgi:hypothetical protein
MHNHHPTKVKQKRKQTLSYKLKWVIPENIHTTPTEEIGS